MICDTSCTSPQTCHHYMAEPLIVDTASTLRNESINQMYVVNNVPVRVSKELFTLKLVEKIM